MKNILSVQASFVLSWRAGIITSVILILCCNAFAQDYKEAVRKMFENKDNIDIALSGIANTPDEHRFYLADGLLVLIAKGLFESHEEMALKDIDFSKTQVRKDLINTLASANTQVYALELIPLNGKTNYAIFSGNEKKPWKYNMSLYFASESLATAALQYLKEKASGTSQPTNDNFNPFAVLVDEFIDSGVEKLKKEDISGAISDFTAAIKLDPKNYTAFCKRGLAYFGQGEYEKSIADYSKAIDLSPQTIETYDLRGFAYFTIQDWDKALADFCKAIEISPQDYSAYNNRGQIYFITQKFDKAIADFTKSIGLSPQSVESYFYRGQSYSFKGNYEKSLADYSKVIEMSPSFKEAYNNRAITYLYLEKTDLACKDWKKSLELGLKEAQQNLDMYCK